jgi:hypothetical protein
LQPTPTPPPTYLSPRAPPCLPHSYLVDSRVSGMLWSDIYQLFRLQLASYRGRVVSMPLDGSTMYLINRRDVFDRLGLQVGRAEGAGVGAGVGAERGPPRARPAHQWSPGDQSTGVGWRGRKEGSSGRGSTRRVAPEQGLSWARGGERAHGGWGRSPPARDARPEGTALSGPYGLSAGA